MNNRLVRIFISSTFRDFMEERDLLVKNVFPELRRRCRERFVELVEVDLRWGITEEQSRQGETLRICLQEIDRCRASAPVFFIGLLGERYGWIPKRDYFKNDILEDPDLGWVKEHIGGKSVTELEILHGVLRNEKMRDKSFFYFRNDGYEKRNWSHIEEYHKATRPALTPADFDNSKPEGKTPQEATEAQRNLKQRIRDASMKWEPTDYEMPSDMAKKALEHIWEAINEVYPAESVPDELERESLEHQAFARSRTQSYLPREGLFSKLDSMLEQEAPSVMVVKGASGSGKTALLAAWLDHAKEHLPKRAFFHFIGGNAESSSADKIVFRLLKTIRKWGDVDEQMPDNIGDAVEKLPEWLGKAAEGGSILLVMDALNQLEDERDQALWWLKSLPNGVRLIVSTLPGIAERSLHDRGWLGSSNTLEIPLLNKTEKRGIIQSYLARTSRTIEENHLARIAEAPQTDNPLFLKVMLDELRIRAWHDNFQIILERLLGASDLAFLLGQVLENLEEYDRDRPRLVRESLSYLAVARRGLTEPELLELLSPSESPALEPLPRHYWSGLFLALEESMVNKNGQLFFFHDFLKQAIIQKYLGNAQSRIKIHRRLGEVAMCWDTDRFGASLRQYGLQHGVYHLALGGRINAALKLAKSEAFVSEYQKLPGGLYVLIEQMRGVVSLLSKKCAENSSFEDKLADAALLEGQLREKAGHQWEYMELTRGNIKSAHTCMKLTSDLAEPWKWICGVRLLLDAASNGLSAREIKSFTDAIIREFPGRISFNEWSHLTPESITVAKNWIIPTLIKDLLNTNADAAFGMLEQLEVDDRCRFMSYAGLLMSAKQIKLIGPRIVSQLQKDSVDWPFYTIPIIWHLSNAAGNSARVNRWTKEYELAVENIASASNDAESKYEQLDLIARNTAKCESGIPGIIREKLSSMWESGGGVHKCLHSSFKKYWEQLVKQEKAPPMNCRSPKEMAIDLIRPNWGKTPRASAWGQAQRDYEHSFKRFCFVAGEKQFIQTRQEMRKLLGSLVDKTDVQDAETAVFGESARDKAENEKFKREHYEELKANGLDEGSITACLDNATSSHVNWRTHMLSDCNTLVSNTEFYGKFQAPLDKWKARQLCLDLLTRNIFEKTTVQKRLVSVIKRDPDMKILRPVFARIFS